MKNIFSDIKDYVKQPNRNVFDMSFQNNATFNFGTLYPVFCKEVIPGDSVSIDTTFALRFLPMAFPVQTKVQANLHFFYVRNRNLWENWKKFITHTDDVQFPVLDGSQSCLTTGGLADYLGIPTTLVGNYNSVSNIPLSYFAFKNNVIATNKSNYFDNGINSSALFNGQTVSDLILLSGDRSDVVSKFLQLSDGNLDRFTLNSVPVSITLPFNSVSESGNHLSTTCTIIFSSLEDNGSFYPFMYVEVVGVPKDNTVVFNLSPELEFIFKDDVATAKSFSSTTEMLKYIRTYCSKGLTLSFYQPRNVSGILPISIESSQFVDKVSFVYGNDFSDEFVDLSNLPSFKNPFVTNNSSNIPISALPFRAYESIYNSFYRNELNDPLFVNGKPTYDVYCPNTSDGLDDYDYKLYNRNWELDFLTSAVQSPQQGIAPLVGVSSSGNFTFVNKDSNGNVGYFTADAQFSSDGTTITGFKLSDKLQLSGIPTTDVGNVPDDIKRGTIYNLNQMALAGISINDFRNVNALQRWLETNIRRGYKYRDQIKSHYGVDVSYQELDMPEFIGGISEPVFVNQVNQTTETESDPLGSYAGQMSLLASSNHTIRHYADEHGFIMGIMSITPVPNYSQLLPKHFIKYNYLDYFFPEFGHIGMQPIDYREVCPLQVYGVNPSDVNNTFGYQRAWYDYIASVDEVHGLFRTNLRNFVLNRQFDTLPKLNKDFLQVDANQLNDIFTVQDISDKILGQIKFNCIFKRPIPKYGIPRLE